MLTEGTVVQGIYICTSCRRFKYFFLLHFGKDDKGDFVEKVGQEPPWDISISKAVARALGDHVDEYKKGLICESQGYGIGAHAYYRRIVEDIIDGLLAQIGEMLAGEEHARYVAALERAKQTRVTQDKIELVKALLPATLRPDDLNPLSILHDVLSEGLHGASDERCLELAASIREVLVFLITRVVSERVTAKSFTEGMRKLLERHVPEQPRA